MENSKNQPKIKIIKSDFFLLFILANILIFIFASMFDFRTNFLLYITIISLIIGSFSGFYSIKCTQKKEKMLVKHQTKSNIYFFHKIFLTNCLLLIGPLFVLVIDYLNNGCFDIHYSLSIFILIYAVSLYFTSALGFLVGVLSTRLWVSLFFYFLYLLSTQIYHFSTLVFGPSTYFFNSFYGFFHWSFHESDILITSELLIARLSTILLASMFVILTLIISEIFPGSEKKFIIHQFFKKVFKKISLLKIIFIVLFLLNFLVFIFKCDLGLTTTYSFIEKKMGGKTTSPHFIIYYKKNSIVSKNILEVVKEHEFRYEQLKKIFNVQPSRKIESYIFTNSNEKRELIGEEFTESANYLTQKIFTIFNSNPQFSRLNHELAHIFSVTDLSAITKVKLLLYPGFLEGIAMAVDKPRVFSNNLTLHQKAKIFIKNSQIRDKILLYKDFLFTNTHFYYVTNGSFIRFLMDTYGIEKLKSALNTQDINLTYGTPFKSLVLDWIDFLNSEVEIPPYFIKESKKNSHLQIKKKKCRKEIKKVLSKAWELVNKRHYKQAVNFFKIGLLDNNNDVVSLFGLMKSLYHSNRYNESIQISDQIINNPYSNITSIATTTEYKAMSFWKQNNLEKAEKTFRILSNFQMPIEFMQRIQIKLLAVTHYDSSFKNKILTYFTIYEDKEKNFSYLKDLSLEYPNSFIIHYLLGKSYNEKKEFKKSNKYLFDSLYKADSGNLINKNIFRLIGSNYYHLHNYDLALIYLNKIFKFKLTPGEITLISDFIEKCKWGKKNNSTYL